MKILKLVALTIAALVLLKFGFMIAAIIAVGFSMWILLTLTKKGKVWNQFLKCEFKSMVDKTTRLKFAIAQLKQHKEDIWEEGAKFIERNELLAKSIATLERKKATYLESARVRKADGDDVTAKEYLRLVKQTEKMIESKSKFAKALMAKAKKVKFNMEKIDIKVDELENLLSEIKLTKSDIDAKRLLSGGINNDSIQSIVDEINAEIKGEEFKNSLIDAPEDESIEIDVDEDYNNL